jgi:hypothetical protein
MCQSPLGYEMFLEYSLFPEGPSERDPLIPARAPSSVSGYDKNVMLVTSPSDALSQLKKIEGKHKIVTRV